MMLEPVGIAAATAAFPRVAGEDLDLANLLATRGLTISPTLGGTTRPLLLAPARLPSGPRAAVACRIAGQLALLSIAQDDLDCLQPALAAGTRLADLPDALAMAVAEVALRPLLDALTERLAMPFALEAPRGKVPAEWSLAALCPAEEVGAAPLAVLHLGPEAAASVIEQLRNLSAAPSWEAAALAQVPLGAQLAGSSLSLAELTTLALGDVILLPPGARSTIVEIVAGNHFRRIGAGRCEGFTVTIDSLSEGAMLEAQDDDDVKEQPEEGGGALAVDDIEVRIGFSLGQRLVSVAELRTLTRGYIFELEPQDCGEVGIVANGRTLGRGELVQLDDRLGVRILRLTRDSDG